MTKLFTQPNRVDSNRKMIIGDQVRKHVFKLFKVGLSSLKKFIFLPDTRIPEINTRK